MTVLGRIFCKSIQIQGFAFVIGLLASYFVFLSRNEQLKSLVESNTRILILVALTYCVGLGIALFRSRKSVWTDAGFGLLGYYLVAFLHVYILSLTFPTPAGAFGNLVNIGMFITLGFPIVLITVLPAIIVFSLVSYALRKKNFI